MHEPTRRKRENEPNTMALGYVDKKEGTIYAELTRKFPITSIHGMTAILIMYDWTPNAILATPIKEAKAENFCRIKKKRT